MKPFFFNRSSTSKLQLYYHDQVFEKQIVLSEVNAENNFDWIIICLKEYHYAQGLDDLKLLITPTKKVAVIRNGIDLKAPLLDFTAPSNILECMIDAPTQPDLNGTYHLISFPKINMEDSDLARSFSNLFDEKKIGFNYSFDFKTEQWKKLIESASLGAIMCMANNTAPLFREKKISYALQKINCGRY